MRKYLVVASLAIGVALASPAAAAMWSFVWSSIDSLNTGVTTGDSVATITPETALVPTLDLAFSTPAGTAHLTVVDDPTGPFAFGTAPIKGPDDTWMLHGVGPIPDGYTWTGAFDSPDTFSLHAFNPGSGPDPRQDFSGTGTLASAAEPGSLLMVLSGLAGAVTLRRRRA